MTKRSANHATFTIERSFPSVPAKVFAAFASREAKGRWFVGPDEWEKSNLQQDFRVGGHESISGGPPGGPIHKYSALFCDIVPNERIVTTYEMHMDDKRISVSLATIELKPEGSGTKLMLTEQGVFLDGYDDAGSREHGTKGLLDKLGKELALQSAVR